MDYMGNHPRQGAEFVTSTTKPTNKTIRGTEFARKFHTTKPPDLPLMLIGHRSIEQKASQVLSQIGRASCRERV